MSKIIISQAQLLFVEDFLLGFPGPRTVETKSLEAEPVSSKTSLVFFFFSFCVSSLGITQLCHVFKEPHERELANCAWNMGLQKLACIA